MREQCIGEKISRRSSTKPEFRIPIFSSKLRWIELQDNPNNSSLQLPSAVFMGKDASSLDVFVDSSGLMMSGTALLNHGHLTVFKTWKLSVGLCFPESMFFIICNGVSPVETV